jgi:hypothetical protein
MKNHNRVLKTSSLNRVFFCYNYEIFVSKL